MQVRENVIVPLYPLLRTPVAAAARTERPSTARRRRCTWPDPCDRLRTGVPELLTHRVPGTMEPRTLTSTIRLSEPPRSRRFFANTNSGGLAAPATCPNSLSGYSQGHGDLGCHPRSSQCSDLRRPGDRAGTPP